MKPALAISAVMILFSCNNRSMRGIDDGLTVIGVILALMIGAYYFIKKVWLTARRKDEEN